MTEPRCPRCGGSLQERTPLVPAYSNYSCEDCTYRWRGRGELPEVVSDA